MKQIFLPAICLLLGFPFASAKKYHDPVVTNPINLNYQFAVKEPKEVARREAADPVCELFGDEYYLFASKSSGYWRSKDLAEWEYIPAVSIPTVNDYAPTVCEIDGELYFMASDTNRTFKTATPRDGSSWKEIECVLPYQQHDPCIYKDDDGRTYIYWGCHDKDPIMGVEIDVKNGLKPIGEPVALIEHRTAEFGWEVPGEANEETFRQGWNEGPAMIKVDGKYYLQYAAPGTQYRIYGDGIYVGDNPLGPFKAMEGNPFSFKPGGFIGGAGHGHTFKDRYGNWWHVASMKISKRHWFERRLGLFPVYIDTENNTMKALTEGTDHPFVIPQKKFDTSKPTVLGYRQLSAGAEATASSSADSHYPALATDETVETWWAAESGKKGEWFQVDLGKVCSVKAIQPNFADDNMEVYRPYDFPVAYDYTIYGSKDGKKWEILVDMSGNTTIDAPHILHNLDKAAKARYVKIVNNKDISGRFSLFDLRVFGDNGHKLLNRKVTPDICRDAADTRHITLDWEPVEGATGYVVRWRPAGSKEIHTSAEVSTNALDARWFNRDTEYEFEVVAR